MRNVFWKSALLTTVVFTSALLSAQNVAWNVGDVFVAANASYQVWRNGALIDSFSAGTGQAGGCAFDSQFNLYGTYGATATSGQVVEFSRNIGTAPSSISTGVYAESVVFDASGHFYVGSPNASVLQFTPNLPPTSSGAITYSAPVTISTGGPLADQIDLGTDQANLFLASSSAFTKTTSANVTRVDLTNSSNTSLTAKVADTAWSVRLLTPGDINPTNRTPINGALVAADSSVIRVDSAGNILKTYKPSSRFKSLRFLALDPDGTSFWVADVGSAAVFRINIATGATTATLTLSGKPTIGGLCVLGGQQLNIVPLQFPGNTTNVTRVASFGDPQIDAITLRPAADNTGQTLSPNYHTWSATIDAVSAAFSLVVSVTGEGPQSSTSSLFLDRFNQFFCGQAEPGSCASPSSPTLVPIPYSDQTVGNFGIPTVTGSGTQLSPGNRVVYRVANPPATGNITAAIHFLQPPVCSTINGTLVSPVLTGTSNTANCYIPAACPSGTSNFFVNSPRFMLAPSEGPGSTPDHQFAFDSSINYFRDTGIAGGGGRSDHAVADRCPSSNGGACIATAVFNSPLQKSNNKIGSNMPIKVNVTDCQGNALLGANLPPNAMTISVTGPQDQIEATTGQSFQFFTQNGGAGGTYSGNLVTNGFVPGLTQICVTSTNSTSTTTGSGQFVPVCTVVNMVK